MSGHSKWSQIKRQKGAADVKRGVAFGKLANAIIVAAKTGGDPNSNFALKMAIEKARLQNMPKENIERAIKRGTGEIGGVKIEEVVYEGIGPNNIGIIIETVTDNKNRTSSEVKNILTKYGGKLAGQGAVTYQFKKMGKILIKSEVENKEDLELNIIDAGAEDFEDQNDFIAVYTYPSELEKVKKSLEARGIEIFETGLSWEPQILLDAEDSQSQKIIDMLESLENLNDVTAVHSNLK